MPALTTAAAALAGAAGGATVFALLSARTQRIVRVGPPKEPRMSHSVVHNGTCYLSGITGTEGGATVEAQTRTVLEKLDARMAAAGTDKSRLLSAQIWLKDIDADFAPMNRVWSAWVDPAAKPARATVQSPMARPVVLVEVQAVAAMP